MAASSSYGSVVEAIFLNWIAMAALSRLCLVASSSVEKQLPSLPFVRHNSVKILGTVLCDCCLEGSPTQNAAFLPDVDVAVECKNSSRSRSSSWQATSDRKGNFAVDIGLMQGSFEIKCWAKVLKNPHGFCNTRSTSPAILIQGNSQLPAFGSSSITFNLGDLSYQPQAPLSFCQPEQYSHAIKFRSFHHSQQQTTLQGKPIKNLDPPILGPLILAHGQFYDESERRMLPAILKHGGRPSSYHLEPPDPPQPFYPSHKTHKKASTPPIS